MTQMLVYGDLAYAQAACDLLIAHAAGETQLHHPPAGVGEVVGHRRMNHRDGFIVWPLLVGCRLPVGRIELPEALDGGQVAEMVEAAVADRFQQIRPRHVRQAGREKRLEDIVHNVPRHILVAQHQHDRAVHRGVVGSEKQFYVIFWRHTSTRHVTCEKPNLKINKIFRKVPGNPSRPQS